MSLLATTATTVAAVCAGASGGVYLAFSAMVLPALNARPTREAVGVMRRINELAVRPPFMSVFFGGTVASLAAAATAGASELAPLRVAGAVLSLASVGVTVVANVPRNNALARMQPGADDDGTWRQFVGPWGRANSVRGALALAGAAALAGSLAG